ncbi:potassium-transporting ATPase subunit C [Asticcacaulis sp. EMRT-3]|uniref:potassium-transporting ATPase subunit C n=1 Tax=Asticcacaulis sp. EMRT-3 TaxID=3040349 RepID=UPI0024AEE221|nr:potassium-transporting ATPase subunit C [Asticcacaulis sp. EMRT-3]MDI7776007.1 potassium-transporting ATPase subunit C [Asticcacaulis sp. EMRT-3]
MRYPALFTPVRAPLALLIGGLLLGGVLLPALEQAAVRNGFDQQMRDLTVPATHGTPLASVFTTRHQGDPAYIWGPLYDPACAGNASEACRRELQSWQTRLGPGVPAELARFTPSRLDPVISRAAADFQAPRIARARGVPLSVIEAAIRASTFNPTFSLRGVPSVNLLIVNLRLDHRLA